ncbi:hypothetical protein AgCh_001078 [Apium graveolens]
MSNKNQPNAFPGIFPHISHGCLTIITTPMKLATGESLAVSFVYDLNTAQERRLLWRDLTGLSCIGPRLTWWDSCIADPCFKKLDRCLVNGIWLVNFTMSKAMVLPRGLSDHCPITISITQESSHIRKPFHFFLHLLDSLDFLIIIKEAWEEEIFGDPWFILNTKLMKSKVGLKRLNNYRGNLHTAVEVTRNALFDFQLAMTSDPTEQQFTEEANLIVDLQKH